jgi:hypothetical protein
MREKEEIMDGFTFGSDWINYKIISTPADLKHINSSLEAINNELLSQIPFACVTASKYTG